MSDMVDRVARAIYESYCSAVPGGSVGEWPDLNAASLSLARSQARAAIEAMREPTEAMWRAGDQRIGEGIMYAEDAWRAMADVALKEE